MTGIQWKYAKSYLISKNGTSKDLVIEIEMGLASTGAVQMGEVIMDLDAIMDLDVIMDLDATMDLVSEEINKMEIDRGEDLVVVEEKASMKTVFLLEDSIIAPMTII